MIEWLLGINLELVLIIIGVILVAIALIKSKHARPILVVILCIGWLGLGVYSGTTLYKYEITKNQTIGQTVVHDPYDNFNFYEYELDNIVWYQYEDGTFSYETIYATSLEFEGEENKYQMLINNTPCSITKSENARLYGLYQKQFRDVDGQISDIIDFEINFTFTSSKIKLEIKTNATTKNLATVREYVAVNGFKIRIINSIYST